MVAIFPGSCTKGGTCFAFPDVCKTPIGPSMVPIPYPNLGQVAQAKKTSKKVKFVKKEVVTIKSEIPRTSGDEPGVGKGIVSGKVMGKVTYKKCSSKVKAEGNKVAHLISTTGHNGGTANMIGAQVSPSQTKVIVAP